MEQLDWDSRETLRRSLDECVRAVLYDRAAMEAVRAGCAGGWNRDWAELERGLRGRVADGLPLTEVSADGTGAFAAELLPPRGDLMFAKGFVARVDSWGRGRRKPLPRVFDLGGRR